MKYYAHKVTVKPVGRTIGFPVDMLRYDGLVPLDQTDSSKIHQCCEMNEPNTGGLRIELWKHDVKTWKPNTERWNSFLWSVVGHEVV